MKSFFSANQVIERSFINVRSGLQLAYIEAGKGETMILIPGLGRGAEMWEEQIEGFAKTHHVLALDNRGSGQSDKPIGPYSIAEMAQDVADFMEAKGLSSAHLVGASMGGFIAQEFALRYPEKVKNLVLCSTSPGGPGSVPMEPTTWQKMMEGAGKNPQDQLLEAVELAFSPKFFQRNYTRIFEDVQKRLQNLPPQHAWMAQAQAGATFNVFDRLEKLQSKTLIITGLQDIIVLPANADLLHKLIPNSKVVRLSGGHYVMVESAQEFNKEVLEFLSEKE